MPQLAPVQALLDRTSYLVLCGAQFRCATVRMTPANLSTVGRKSSTQGARKVLQDGHYWTEFHVDMSAGQPVEGALREGSTRKAAGAGSRACPRCHADRIDRRRHRSQGASTTAGDRGHSTELGNRD